MPIPVALRTQLDAAITPLQSKIDAYQSGYLITNGRYWQGIQTPAVIPADGTLGTLDKTLKPTDQIEDWTPLAIVATQAPVSVACHIHDGPLGKGYTIYALVMVTGARWLKAIGFGAHSQAFDWAENTEKP